MSDHTIHGESVLSSEHIDNLLSNDRARVKAVIAAVSRGDLAAYLRTDLGESTLKHAFAGMPSFYVPGRVDTEMTVRWNVERPPAKPVKMDVVITPQQCQTHEASDARTPTVTVTLDALSFIELASATTRGKALLMRGRLKIKGSVQLAMKIETLFALGDQGLS
jgi:hypothetical protein